MDGELTYMRGSKALAAEIGNLQQRKSEDPFILELRDLQTRQQFYQGLVAAKRNFSVYQLDGTIEQPDVPIKPRRNLIIALGVIVGLGTGCWLQPSDMPCKICKDAGPDPEDEHQRARHILRETFAVQTVKLP